MSIRPFIKLLKLSIIWAAVASCTTQNSSLSLQDKGPATEIPLGTEVWQSKHVTQSAPVKAPQPVINFKVNQLPANHLLEIIHRELGYGYEVDECGENPVSLTGSAIPLTNALEAIARQANARVNLLANQIRLQCDTEQMRIYAFDYLALSRRMKDESTLNSDLQVSNRQNANRSGNQSELSLANSQSHDVWDSIVNQIEQLLEEAKPINETRTELQSRENTDRDYTNNRGLASQSDQVKDKVGYKITRKQTLSGKVIAHPESASVAVIGTSSQHQRIAQWLEKIEYGLERQVAVDAVIAEVKLDRSYQKGIDWSAFQQNGIALGLNIKGLDFSGPSATIALNRQTGQSDTSLVLRLLEQFGSTSVISSPRIVTLNQQAAVLKLIDNKVFFTTDIQTTAPTSNNPAFSTFETQVQTVPVGFLMTVTPLVTSQDQIQLRVRPTLTRIVGFVADPNPALAERNIVSQVPEIQTRELESILLLEDGEMALLGGLKQSINSNIQNGIPALTDSLDLLTTSQSKTTQHTELVVLIKARILTNKKNETQEHRTDLDDQLKLATELQASNPDSCIRFLELLKTDHPETPEIDLNLSILQARKGNIIKATSYLSDARKNCGRSNCRLPLTHWQAILETHTNGL